MELLCRKSAEKGVTVGFLGGRNGVAEKAAECLTKQYPGLNVVFTGEEWPVEPKGKSIKNKGKKNTEHSSAPLYIPPYTYPDILFVAYGFPKQEEWIAEHLEKLPVRVMMGVGGSFDYLSGEVSRAPLFLRRMGLEWLYRLFHQPWRLKRQLVLPKFILLVLKQRFFTRRTSYVN